MTKKAEYIVMMDLYALRRKNILFFSAAHFLLKISMGYVQFEFVITWKE